MLALDGSRGVELWRHDFPPALGWWGLSVAAADVDGDGAPELVASMPERLDVLDGTGALELQEAWPGPTVLQPVGQVVGVADLDQDGLPEIHRGAAVLSPVAGWSWSGSAGQAVASNYKATCVAELVPDSPGLELVAGDSLHGADGSLLWQNGAVADGICGVGDVTGDDSAEIVIAGRPRPG